MAEPKPRDIGIYFLDVGQGDCTVIVPPEREGGAIVFDIADPFVLERFVGNHGLQVSDVVASHLDIDHIRGMLHFLRNHVDNIDRVYLGTDRKPKPGLNANLRELVTQVDEWSEARPIPTVIAKDNWRDHESPVLIREGKDWKVELILPFNTTRHKVELEDGQHPNICSAVLRVERAGTAVLIGGDAPLGSWEMLGARQPGLMPASAIRVPHHGGDATEWAKDWHSYGDLYSRVRAKLAVISVGTNNQYRHPRVDHVEAMRQGGTCRLLCTQLTPRCHEAPLELRSTMTQRATMVEPPYRQWDEDGKPRNREVPCAGTIVVWIDASGELHHEPSPGSEHSKLLLRIDNPMCEHKRETTSR